MRTIAEGGDPCCPPLWVACSEAWAKDGTVQTAVRQIKARFPELLVFTDVCMCEYTSHGHCGILTPEGEVHNDLTLRSLAKIAISHAEAGADFVAPSDMMDGRVGAIRSELDNEGFQHVGILAYSVKYASAYYGPFREAADSAPQHGDRKGYQMDPANAREAEREALADIAEGADIIMVKPALAYLDIIQRLRPAIQHPLAAYNVSGEYAMIKFAGQHGLLDATQTMLETLTAIKRAGADIIITYAAREVAELLSH